MAFTAPNPRMLYVIVVALKLEQMILSALELNILYGVLGLYLERETQDVEGKPSRK